ncbi:Na/Pi cotransporter family protein [Fretibacterium sp. OH1220_COT-178]|uniref:Na/Pi cotransporter family protein n=1 Tax=Fretibacterium sp. OH1220_COT-178 TaxID=2491047 RepID=UPI000F600FD9|nr:Na/Pi cotransporter family protein [Fretibacterium sp. OH1220_COT-178]RRD66298.1 Na/Pi cotransporter family protein [Fretibacterium sp. OH1220_COT-178]
MDVSTLLQVAGGVGLFLYGIKLMSEALQFIAGDRMRHLIGTLTKTPLRGVFIGILVTVLIQSSSGTTVMTVSFVNAGLMTLKQAIGIIMGANIGTTVTAQIIAFKIKDFALPFIALGVALALFGKSKKQRYTGNGIVGFGLLFMGMQTMESATKFMASQGDFLLFLGANPLYGVLAGTILTMIVQSSAATIGLTIAMASQGLLGLDVAIPIILGDNIGTTITAVLAALGTNRYAKQAAAAHVLFNLFGVLIFLIFLPFYKLVVIHTATDVGRQLANAHTIFNIANTIIFIPFASLFARMIQALIPISAPTRVEDTLYLDKKLLDASPAAAVEAVKDELLHMGQIAQNMLRITRRAYSEPETASLADDFMEQEKLLNELNKGISSYASEIWQRGLSGEVSTVLGCYVNASGDLERVGDHLENLMELSEVRLDDGSHFSPQANEEFWAMFDTAEEAVSCAILSLKTEDTDQANYVIHDLENRIDTQEKQFRKNHIDRLNRGECDPEKGVHFIDILSNLERIGDHSHNIAYFTHDISSLTRPSSQG